MILDITLLNIVAFHIITCTADVDVAHLRILAPQDFTASKPVVDMEVHGLHVVPVLVHH